MRPSNETRWVHQRAGPLAARVTARRNQDLRTAPKPLKSLGIPPEFECEMVRPSLPAIRRRRESRRAQRSDHRMPVATPPIKAPKQFLRAKSQPREFVSTLGR